MIQKKILFALLAVLFLFVWGCSTVAVQVKSDPNTRFSMKKTFSWLPPPPDEGPFWGFVRARVTMELESKGLKAVPENGKLLVAAHFGTKEKNQFEYRNMGVGMGDYEMYHFDEADLIVALVDPKSKKAVWRGSAEAVVSPDDPAEKTRKIITDGVTRMFKDFPPAP